MTLHVYPIRALSNTARATRGAMSLPLFGATAARPLGARSGVRYGTPVTTVSLVAFAGTVKPHAGVMDVQTSAEAGGYWYAVTANETFTVAAAHATLARVDLVTIRIDDPDEDGTGTPGAFVVYKANPSAGTGLPPAATTTREMAIAYINVPASGGGSPTVSWVAPTAVAAGGIVPVRTTTERDAMQTAYPGTTDAPLIVWRKDAASFEYNDGTGWKAFGGAARPANAAALAAITGMVTGDKAYQVDTGVTYRYNGAAWKGWESDWLTYTATLTGFVIGTGGSALSDTKYRFEQGRVRVRFNFVFGTTGATFPTTPKFTYPPVTPVTPIGYSFYEGNITYATAGGIIATGWVLSFGTSTTTVILGRDTGSGGATALDYPTTTLPITFAAGSVMQGSFLYDPA